MDITQELVKRLFDYKEGFLYWKVRLANCIQIGDKAGHIAILKTGNRNRLRMFGKNFFSARLIFLWHKGYLPDEVDHENRNKLDDRIENLRDCSHSQNMKNRSSHIDSNSKYLGVCFVNNRYWRANITLNSKVIYLGQFKTENEAVLTYNREAVRHHKEFANLNIIQP